MNKTPPTLRQKLALLLEGSGSYHRYGHVLDIALISLILLNVIAIVLESVPSIAKAYYTEFLMIEIGSVAIFTFEYLLRVWACVDKKKYRELNTSNTKKRLRYLISPLALIDLIAIVPSLLMFIFPLDLRFLRVLRLLRVFKLTRYSKAMQLLLNAFKNESSSLLAAFFIMAVMLILASCGVYLLEHDIQPDKLGSIPDAMWWAMATLTTVGYGDVVPITPVGKLFGAMITLISMGMVAIPTGLLASSFSEQMRKRRQSFEDAVHKQINNGLLTPTQYTHLDSLRGKLGLTKIEANKIIKIQLTARNSQRFCKHCGQRQD
jgi:voltage-gated potassium channel